MEQCCWVHWYLLCEWLSTCKAVPGPCCLQAVDFTYLQAARLLRFLAFAAALSATAAVLAVCTILCNSLCVPVVNLLGAVCTFSFTACHGPGMAARVCFVCVVCIVFSWVWHTWHMVVGVPVPCDCIMHSSQLLSGNWQVCCSISCLQLGPTTHDSLSPLGTKLLLPGDCKVVIFIPSARVCWGVCIDLPRSAYAGCMDIYLCSCCMLC